MCKWPVSISDSSIALLIPPTSINDLKSWKSDRPEYHCIMFIYCLE